MALIMALISALILSDYYCTRYNYSTQQDRLLYDRPTDNDVCISDPGKGDGGI